MFDEDRCAGRWTLHGRNVIAPAVSVENGTQKKGEPTPTDLGSQRHTQTYPGSPDTPRAAGPRGRPLPGAGGPGGI